MSESGDETNPNVSSSTTPTAKKAPKRIARHLSGESFGGSGNGPPSTRGLMAAPGPGNSRMRRSQSFKRTASGKAASASSGSGSGLAIGSGSEHSTASAASSNVETGMAPSSTTTTTTTSMLTTSPSNNTAAPIRTAPTSTHNFVKNFLEEDDDDVLMKNAMAQAENASGSNLNFMDAEAQRHVHRSLLNPSHSPTPDHPQNLYQQEPSPSSSNAPSSNLFKGRQDFYEVDQSVNLMDAEAGKYESKNRGNQSGAGGGRSHSMVEIFLQDKNHGSSNIGGNGNNRTAQNWWYHPERQAKWNRMSTWDRMVDVSRRMLVPLICCAVILIVILLIFGMHYEAIPENTVVPYTPTPPASAPIVPESPEQAAAASSQQKAAIQKILVDLHVTNPAAFDNPNSPASKALNWVSNDEIALADMPEQQRRLQENNNKKHGNATTRLLQRYVLAVLYYHWTPRQPIHGEDYETGNGHDQEKDSQELGQAQMEEMNSLSGSVSINNGREQNELWLSTTSECNWHGISCHDEVQELAAATIGDSGGVKVRKLNLTAHNLTGAIPVELNALGPHLVQLDLRHNRLHGNLDAIKYKDFPNLEYLLLSRNYFEGTIPVGLHNLESLIDIDLAYNKLTGDLPVFGNKLEHLESVYWNNNDLKGTISEKMLEHMPRLEYLELSNCTLTGELPWNAFEKLSSLRFLHLRHNQFSSTIPEDIKALKFLETLSIEYNNFEGELPDVFEDMHRLESINAAHNGFSGRVPPSLMASNRLKYLHLEHNALTGVLPSKSWFTSSKKLVQLSLADNRLSGPLPTEVSNLKSTLEELHLSRNAFSGVLPSEWGELSQLKVLAMNKNVLEGTIPSSWSGMKDLEQLGLFENTFEGEMPQGVCKLNAQISADCHSGDIKCACCHKCY